MKQFVSAGLAVGMSLFVNSRALARQGECDAGQCVVFEVSIKLDSYHETPVLNRVTNAITLDGTYSPYDVVVTRAGDTCTKQVKVPLAIYNTITTVMGRIGGPLGQPAPVLTPTEQTILLLYTTLMQQTIGFTCSPRELGLDRGDGHGSGTGSGTQPYPDMVRSGRLAGIFQVSDGGPVAMIEENGVSRNVRAGEYLAGGWRIEAIRSDNMIITRGTQRVLVPVGGRY